MEDKETKSICIVSPSLKMGGIERSLVILANYFSQSNYLITFISCFGGERHFIIGNRVQLSEPRFRHTGSFLSTLVFYPKLLWYIRKKVKKANPDVILTFGDLFNSLVLISVIGLYYPVYISDRTSPEYHLPFPIPWLKQWLYPKSAGFIAQTKGAADFKKKQFGDKLRICVIPNALREIKLYPDLKRERIILFVGRFAWEKGPERLIRAFKEIPDRKGWTLHMAGSGPQLNEMRQMVSALGISKEVVFHGNMQDVDLLYARAGVYVLPSLLEGFPNSLCEAMAAGLPCVCFDTIPYEELFTHGVDGLVVRGDDINALSNTLKMLMDDEQLRKSIGSKAQKIQTRLNVEKVGQQVKDFIFGE